MRLSKVHDVFPRSERREKGGDAPDLAFANWAFALKKDFLGISVHAGIWIQFVGFWAVGNQNNLASLDSASRSERAPKTV
jgi:hypothetical protein